MLVAESFLRSLLKICVKHTGYSDCRTWYPVAYSYLNFEHRPHSHLEKNIIERTIEYFKDSTEHSNE